ncbi:MAG: sulfite exporter TauE/SafE family protein [Planctomycetota bacterium]|jgi:hypothetical protein
MAMSAPPTPLDPHRGRFPLLHAARRTRRVVAVAGALVVFAAAAALWHYLGTGRWWSTDWPVMVRRALAPFDVFIFPLSVTRYRWMILVDGLVLGVLVAGPLMAAACHRLRVALLFVLVLAGVAQNPVLAFALGLGCLLVARTRLRSNAPMLACLLGLIPVIVCIAILDMLGTLFPAIATVPPLRRWLGYMPFAVAIASTVVALSAALGLARLLHYRAGVMAPVLVLLVAAPATIFYDRIGSAELDYALTIPSRDGRMVPVGDTVFEPMSLDTFRRVHDAHGLSDALLHRRVVDDFDRRRHSLIANCRQFLQRHRLCRRAPAIAWLTAQCESLHLDDDALADGWIRSSAQPVRPVSQEAWEHVVTRYGQSPYADLARLRLAELALRAQIAEIGHAATVDHPAAFRRAYDLLTEAEAGLARLLNGQTKRPPARAAVFSRPVSWPSTGYYLAAHRRARLLMWLMDRNKVLQDADAAEALAVYLTHGPQGDASAPEDPFRLGEYGQTNFGANLRLAAALAESDADQRASLLQALADQTDDEDAAIQANYELARLMLEMAPAARLGGHGPAYYFRRVAEAGPSPWQRSARENLDWLVDAADETP